jgi:hypothetical protein
MACRNAYKTQKINVEADVVQTSISEPVVAQNVERLLFGVDSKIQANDLLQNNIEEFEWIVLNKIYPNFYGRYLTGDNCLSKDEIKFLHSKGCKIAAIYTDEGEKQTEEQGTILAKKIDIRALELSIPERTVIFLEIGENEVVSRDFMRGFAKSLMFEGYTPGFKANTDAKFAFDREFSRGMQTDKDVFKMCLIWAVTPTVEEYNGITTSHLIHPDNWMPYAPSGITRNEIAIWQYGKGCHPIEDDMGRVTTFNLNLVLNEQVIVEKMF